ncbi:MAG: ROK family protein [Suipraeoptans sp.]
MKQQGTTNREVKKVNRNKVFRYLNSRENASMPEIAAGIGVSTPTVLTIVSELLRAGVVCEEGELESTGGRKAKAYSVVSDSAIFIGLDITKNHIGIVCTDLSEAVRCYKRDRVVFELTDVYLRKLAETVESFLTENNIKRELVKGIGVSVPGIVDANRNYLKESHLLNIKQGLSCEELCKYIPYDCYLVNDANAGAMAECTGNNIHENMVYLSLSNSVGGALIFKAGELTLEGNGYFRNLYVGDNWTGGEFGHIVIHPEGETCYCNKKGCLDAYCSALVLANKEGGRLEKFFEKLEAGNIEYRQIWEDYLKNLSYAIDTLIMSFDCEIVLGGYVGSFLEPYIEEYKRTIKENSIFKQKDNFLRAAKYKIEASALGAAAFLVEEFITLI